MSEATIYIPEITIEVKVNRIGKQRFVIKTSSKAYEFMLMIFDRGSIEWREEMILLCMNRANEVIGYHRVSSGGTSGTVVDPKVIYTIVLNTPGTCGIIIAHNHPSGNLNPSSSDETITQRIKNAGLLLDVTLLDHLIVTPDGFMSFADQGLI